MSDNLVSRVKRLARIARRALETNKCMSIWCADPDTLEAAAAALTEARAEIERLRGEVYVPGQWRCAKCKFVLQQANLNANTGTVTARDVTGDKCPNCNSPLWRVTWMQDAHEMLDRATEQMERAKTAESELSTLRARVREVVGPLVDACEADYVGEVCKDEDPNESVALGENGTSALTFGMIYAARQLMEDLKDA